MTSELQRKIEYARSIKPHLAALSSLVARPVSSGELMDLESTRALQAALRAQPSTASKMAKLPFSALRTAPFGRFIVDLATSAPLPVHVWIDTTDACGILTVRSLLEFNFHFDFDDEPAGIIILRTADLANRMLLDFSEDEGGRFLELEWSGPQWSQVDLPALG
jgi:hypothetical protein